MNSKNPEKICMKFPLLYKIIFSDVYRTSVALCLVLAMVWSLNEPKQGGWFALFVLVVWVGVRLIRKNEIRGHPLLFLGLVYGLYLIIPKSTETLIPMYYVATAIFWMVLIYCWLIYDATGVYLHKKHWENTLIVIAIMAVGLTLFEAIGWFREAIVWRDSISFQAPNIVYRASGTFAHHPNSLAALLNAIWPLVLLRLFQTKNLIGKLLSSILLALILLTIILTNSRGGILATSAIAGCLVVYSLMAKYPKSFRRPIDIWHSVPARDKKFGGVAFILFLTMAGFVFWRAAFTGNQASILNSRNLIWKFSWEVFTRSPWFGNGAGSFVKEYAQIAMLPVGFVSPHAHNLELQILAISGITGIMFLLVAFILTTWTFFNTLWKIPAEEKSHFVILSVLFVGIIVHNQFDYLLEGSTWNIVTYIILMGLFINFDRQSQSIGSRHRWIPAVLLIGFALLFPVLKLSSQFREQDRYEQSVELSKAGEWEAAYPIICNTAALNPNNQFYRFQCSLLLSLSGYSEENSALLAEALVVQGEALLINPWWPVNRANYAGLLWSSGKIDDAFDEMHAAAQGVTLNAPIFLNDGLMADKLGKTSEAETAYILAMLCNPLLIMENQHFPSSTGQFAQSKVQDLVYTLNTWNAFQTEVTDMPFTSERQWTLWRGMAAAQFGDFPVAQEILLNGLNKYPDGIGENAYYAYILSKFGISEEAQKFAEIALFAAERRQITDGESNGLWFSYYIAGHVLLKTGRLVKARDPLFAAFKMLNLPFDPGRYETFVYNNNAPIWDLNPVLDWGILSPELESDFRWLAATLENDGDHDQARQIIRWLDIQNKPKLLMP